MKKKAPPPATNLVAHPFADLFPMMSSTDFDELVASMRAEGYDPNVPIILYNGKILDGRNRYAAAKVAGVTPTFKHVQGTSDKALAFVLRRNLARRHLSTSQRAMLAARLANASRGGDRRSDQAANLPLVSQYAAASKLGVSERSVRKAVALRKLDPQAADDVESGKVTLDGAHAAATNKKKPHIAQATGEEEWWTPEHILDAARTALGGQIDLDPASSKDANKRVGAKRYFDKKKDGLKQQWIADALFLNPPYGTANEWTNALLDEISEKNVGNAILLVNNATETTWLQSILRHASAVCFIAGRAKFVRPDGNDNGTPLQGQIVAYFGGRPGTFRGAFKPLGIVLTQFPVDCDDEPF